MNGKHYFSERRCNSPTFYENSEEIQKIIEKIKDLEKFESMKAVIESLEKRIGDTTDVLEEKINFIEKTGRRLKQKKSNDDKIEAMEKKIYILEKRRLGSDFVSFVIKTLS